MAPGKSLHSKPKKKFQQETKKAASGIKKANSSKLSKKKLKERTLLQIEEINKEFTTIQNKLVNDESQIKDTKVLSVEKAVNVKIAEKRLTPPVSDVSQEELTKTLENFANL
ncbi:uncharacterized protein [Montipora capricornis]|uniref:uncharacterized protein n=1 Tax=Montipora foliosa TaxID=591990 RepID=UPI0035F18CBB